MTSGRRHRADSKRATASVAADRGTATRRNTILCHSESRATTRLSGILGRHFAVANRRCNGRSAQGVCVELEAARAAAAQGTAPQHGFSATGPGRRQILGFHPPPCLATYPIGGEANASTFDEPGGTELLTSTRVVRAMLIMVSTSAASGVAGCALWMMTAGTGAVLSVTQLRFLTDFFVFWIMSWLPLRQSRWLHQKVAEKRATPVVLNEGWRAHGDL
jgi:hypothetical protein